MGWLWLWGPPLAAGVIWVAATLLALAAWRRARRWRRQSVLPVTVMPGAVLLLLLALTVSTALHGIAALARPVTISVDASPTLVLNPPTQSPGAHVEVRVERRVEPRAVPAEPERRAAAVPIDEASLSELVLDLRTATFPSHQLEILRREAPRWQFAPDQASRVVLVFMMPDDRLGALEVLKPQLLPGDRRELYAVFDGPFGGARQARLILGD